MCIASSFFFCFIHETNGGLKFFDLKLKDFFNHILIMIQKLMTSVKNSSSNALNMNGPINSGLESGNNHLSLLIVPQHVVNCMISQEMYIYYGLC